MLIGNPGLSLSQSQAQMAIWCILPAPLFMSNDPRTISSKFEFILLNRDAIAINQDKLAIPGERIFHNETIDIWRRELSDSNIAILLLNRVRGKHIRIQIPLAQIANEKMNKSSQVQVLDVFRGSFSLIDSNNPESNWIDVVVKPTGVAFMRLKPL